MSLILNIETATDICSVALAKDGLLLSIAESDKPKSHAVIVTKFIGQVIKESNLKISQIDAIAVSKGPGSYTGLRIGTATAKGMCYALNKPLIAINTLQSMTSLLLDSFPPQALNSSDQSKPSDPGSYRDGTSQTLFAPLIDARRMEVYSSVFDIFLNVISETKAEILSENSFSELLKKNKIIFFGDGADKFSKILGSKPNADFIEDFKASAKGMLSLSEKAFAENKFEDIAYFEPFYLKDFVANRQKSQIH